MTISTTAFGIFQPDIIIKSALEQGLAIMRARPWLLDFCFASLQQDELTKNDYGEKTMDRAKQWFLRTKVPVFLGLMNNVMQLPCVSIKLVASTDDATTLGDVNYDPTEDIDLRWDVLYGPFNAESYDETTGRLVLPSDVEDQLVLSAGQVIIDKVGTSHSIEEVIDGRTVVIETGLNADFSGAVVKGEFPSYIATLEGSFFRETYSLGIHGMEPEQTIWLHSIIVFILLAFKEKYLEARNFERSTVQSTDLIKNPSLPVETEYAHSRYITLSGFVRQMWPKSIAPKITGVVVQPNILDGGEMFPNDAEDQPWIGDEDDQFY